MSKTKTKTETEKPDEAKSEAKHAPLGGKILNAPTVTNTGGFENRAIQGAKMKAGMAGYNSGGFENRVIQEQGTH